ncbi:MAG TPA: hypothetical protein PLS50_09140, partial [Candidatus Dojkabacteria bacterium]|nr:hypothetical protein [Candidatus Dojkabacteria bacterium]
MDGVTFESIATVSAKGSSGSRHDYLFVDEQSADLLKRTSIIFYRLKQNSFNGDYEYSGVASVNEYGKAIFEIFSASPNPFRNQANVLFKTSSDAPILV